MAHRVLTLTRIDEQMAVLATLSAVPCAHQQPADRLAEPTRDARVRLIRATSKHHNCINCATHPPTAKSAI